MIQLFLKLLTGFTLQILPFAMLCIYPFTNSLRYSKHKTYLRLMGIVICLGTIFSIVCCYVQQNFSNEITLYDFGNYVFLICIIPCFLCYFYMIQAPWQQKLAIFFFITLTALLITSICNVIIGRLQNDITNQLPYDGLTIPVIFLVTLLIFPLLVSFIKYGYAPIAKQLSLKSHLYFGLLFMLIFFIFGSILQLKSYSDYINMNSSLSLYILLMISMGFIFVIIFKLFVLIQKNTFIQQQAQEQMQLNQQQYKRISENIESAKQMRHDLKHHMLALQGYIEKNELDKAQVYIKNYIANIQKHELLIHSKNLAIDYIVSHYHILAQEKNISFQYLIDVPKDLSIDAADLSIILGNLLDNALEAVSAIDVKDVNNRYINLHIIYSGKMLVITLDNPYIEKAFTFKPYPSNHQGIGLISIKNIAEQYDGGVEFKTSNHIFYSSVMLNLTETTII